MTYRERAGALVLVTAAALGGVAATTTPADAAPDEDSRPLFRLEDERIDSSSGLVVAADGKIVYTLQDAGKPAAVYAVDLTGQTRLTLEVPGVKNEDWEDLARGVDEQGRPVLYVSDMGDAYFTRRRAGEATRTTFSLLRMREPDVALDQPPTTAVAQDVVNYPVVYPDRLARNSEALAVQPETGRIFVVDRTAEATGTANVWVAPAVLSTTAPNELTKVASLPVAQVTAAAFSPDGHTFVVRDYRYAYLWPVVGTDLALSLRERPVVVTLPPQPQGEGLAFEPDGKHLLVSSEGKGSLVWQVPLPGAESTTALTPATASADDTSPGSTDWTAVWVLAGASAGVLALAVLQRASSRRRRTADVS